MNARMSAAEGDELRDLRTRIAQELKRILVRLRFTPTNILADYRVGRPGRDSALDV